MLLEYRHCRLCCKLLTADCRLLTVSRIIGVSVSPAYYQKVNVGHAGVEG